MEQATVEIAASLTAPMGEQQVTERRIVVRCVPCATQVLARYMTTWPWQEMRVTTTHGRFGRCYGDHCARVRS